MESNPTYLDVKFGQDVWHDELYDGQSKDFFDREEEKRIALDVLRAPGVRQVVWIVGERRAGKTSTMRLLVEKCRQQDMAVFEVPCQSIRSPADFHREYLAGLAKALQAQTKPMASESGVFWQEIERLKAEAKNKVPVVAIDEIDTILFFMEGSQQKEVIGAIQRLMDMGHKIIITSVRRPESIEETKASPLIRQSVPIVLLPFEKEDLDELVDFYLPSCSADERKKIYDLSGGWPYYAKAILYHLLQISPDRPDRFEHAVQNVIQSQSIGAVCEHIYRHHWNLQERRALLLLARQETVTNSDLETLDPAARLAFNLLVERGYLQKTPEGEYRFLVELIGEWIKQWIHRELQEGETKLEEWLRKLAWREEAGERRIDVTKDELQRRGF